MHGLPCNHEIGMTLPIGQTCIEKNFGGLQQKDIFSLHFWYFFLCIEPRLWQVTSISIWCHLGIKYYISYFLYSFSVCIWNKGYNMHWNKLRVILDNILTKVYFDLLVSNMLNGFNQNAIYVLCPQNVYQGNEWYIMSSNRTWKACKRLRHISSDFHITIYPLASWLFCL